MTKIWVIAADSWRARLFRADSPAGKITEVRTLVNPEARLREGELITDTGGGGQALGGASRHIFNQPSEKEHQENLFARQVAEEIEQLRREGKLDRVYVVAEPRFLGRLRENYSRELQKRVGVEVPRHVTAQSPARIRELLPFRI